MEKKSVKKDRHLSMRAMFLVMVTIVFAFVPVVSVQGDDEPNIVRHEGYSRENVAENVAKAHFSDSNKVILVNREKFPDAISATNISQGEYPVLYTYEGRVAESTMDLLESMGLDEIYILGGTLSINESVVGQLEATGVEVTRIAGRSRYNANVEAVKEQFTQANHVVIASGEVYSDALYGVSYANTIDAPVVLTKTNQLESSTVELLKDLGVNQATVIGGELTVTPAVENQLSNLGISHNRIAGRNRYIGSAEVAAESYPNPQNLVIASGEIFSDALVSAPLAQQLDAPILLVRSNRMEEQVNTYISNNLTAIENIYIQGGPKTIGYSILDEAIEAGTKDPDVIEVKKEVVETEDIPYKVERLAGPTMMEGEEEVHQEGVNGSVTRVYEVTYHNGEEVGREIISETVDSEPIPEIVFYGTGTGAVEVFDSERFNQEMLALVNELRRSVGVTELGYNPDLQEGASVRARELKDVFSHTRPDGSLFITAFGFEEPNYYLGENIALNFIDLIDLREQGEGNVERVMAEMFFNQYYNSPGHYNNMIDPRYEYLTTSTIVTSGRIANNVQIFDKGFRLP